MFMVASNRVRLMRRSLLGASVALLTVFAVEMGAQGGERIILPRRPSPNQTLAVKLTQDMDMQMTVMPPEGAQGQQQIPGTPPPMKVNGTMSMAATQTVGKPDDQGRTPCEFKYTDASLNMKMNGMEMPGDQFHDQFVGKTMTFAYAPDGSVTDVKVPDTPGAVGMKATVQQALNAFTLSLPAKPLSVGESATVPVTIPLSIPMPGGATPPTFKGTVTYKLLRIDGSGNNRVAVLEQKMDATAEGNLPGPGGASSTTGSGATASGAASGGASGGAGSSASGATGGGRSMSAGGAPNGATLTMHMSGGGQVQVDLARGVARSGELETTMDGTLKRPTTGAMALMGGDLHMQGTTKMKMSTDPQETER